MEMSSYRHYITAPTIYKEREEMERQKRDRLELQGEREPERIQV